MNTDACMSMYIYIYIYIYIKKNPPFLINKLNIQNDFFLLALTSEILNITAKQTTTGYKICDTF